MELMTIHFFVACSEPEYSNFGSAKAFGGAACPNLTETHSCSPGDVCALPKTLHGWGRTLMIWDQAVPSIGSVLEK